MRNIFITGATGFLASNLLKILAAKEDARCYLLIRARDNNFVLKRRDALIKRVFPNPKQPARTSCRIEVIRGDLTETNLGLSKKIYLQLRDTIDTVYHCAATSEFGYNLTAIRKVNVKGTQNLLQAALEWKKKGCLNRVNHISTVYIAGDFKGIFYEKYTDVSQRFNNSYEQSKFEAELVVLDYRKKGLPVDIYRPSIITDSFKTEVRAISALLQPFLFLILEIFDKIPANKDAKLNMIPVDIASKAIYLISTTGNRPHNQTYHIVNPVGVKLSTLLDAASAFFKFKKPECIALEKFDMQGLSLIQRKMIKPFSPYLNQRLSFDMSNAHSILKKQNFKIPPITKKVLIEMFRYYKSSGAVPNRKR